MSVYTPIEAGELEEFLRAYPLGTLLEYRGISAGIENTNYFVTTTAGRFVLTLFESIGFDDLPYYLELMAFLAEHGIPSAHPLADQQGCYVRTFKNKPAALVQRLEGAGVSRPNLRQCQAIGTALGSLHIVGRHFHLRREHTRGPAWRRTVGERLLAHLNPEDAALLRQELDFQAHYSRSGLPNGVIHADLFRDNALFRGDELMGIIDFYYACHGVLLYDLAVTINDWCTRADASLDWDKALAILTAYHRQRPLEDVEHTVWPTLLRVAALRFWLSRLHDRFFPRPGELTQSKNPDEFKRVLIQHVADYENLPKLWV
jgi:homoserine kinase type II